MSRFAVCPWAWSLVTAGLSAQITGTEGLPQLGGHTDLDVVETWNGAPRSVSALAGRVALIHVFWTWWGASTEYIPEVARLHDDYHAHGLRVLGVSEEDPAQIERTIDGHGIRYPVARVRHSPGRLGRFTMQLFVLVDVDGRVISSSNDPPTDRQIDDALQNVAVVAELADDSRYAALRTLLENHEFAAATRYAASMLAQPKLDAEMRGTIERVRAKLVTIATRRALGLPGILLAGDLLASRRELERTMREWRGLPLAEHARESLTRLLQTPGARRELAAGEVLEAILARATANPHELRSELEDLVAEYAGTHAAGRARYRIERIVQRR